jgi:hypothetical protein
VTSVLYELRFGTGKTFLKQGGIVNAMLGGWPTNPILTLADGLPYTSSCNRGDRAQTGNGRDVERMNVVGNPLPAGFTKTIYKQFDTSSSTVPAPGTRGSVGRHNMCGIAQRSVDLPIFKNFRFKERFSVQFRAEAFNLMASPYYVNLYPGFNGSATTFGSLVPVGGDMGNLFNPRLYQMALRFMF